MNFAFTRENKMIRDAVRDWVAKECGRELVAELDETDAFPAMLIKKLGGLGFIAMSVPEAYGGEGPNLFGTCLVIEQIAAAYPALARCYAGMALLGGALIGAFGSEQQKRRFLPPCAEGRLLVAFAHSEKPGAARPLRLAENGGDGMPYVLEGERHYVTNADNAQLLLVSAGEDENAADPDTPTDCFLVDPALPGIAVVPEEKVGCKGAHFCRVHFDHVKLGTDTLLGKENGADPGKFRWDGVLDYFMLGMAAEAVGLAQGAFDYTLKYARQRVQFGQVIGRFAAIRRMLAEMSCAIEAARLMLYRCCWLAEQGQPFSREISMAKFMACEAAGRCTMDGLQIFGGYGYTMEYDIQRYVRDALELSAAGTGPSSLASRIGHAMGL